MVLVYTCILSIVLLILQPFILTCMYWTYRCSVSGQLSRSTYYRALVQACAFSLDDAGGNDPFGRKCAVTAYFGLYSLEREPVSCKSPLDSEFILFNVNYLMMLVCAC